MLKEKMILKWSKHAIFEKGFHNKFLRTWQKLNEIGTKKERGEKREKNVVKTKHEM